MKYTPFTSVVTSLNGRVNWFGTVPGRGCGMLPAGGSKLSVGKDCVKSGESPGRATKVVAAGDSWKNVPVTGVTVTGWRNASHAMLAEFETSEVPGAWSVACAVSARRQISP